MPEKYIVEAKQNADILSFIGGKPFLPPEEKIPSCKLCGSQLTFFFQILCDHIPGWSEHLLSLFFCTRCSNNDYLIPDMLSGDLCDAKVEAKFLENYQKNFSVNLWHKSDVTLCESYKEHVAFHEIIDRKKPRSKTFGYSAVKPKWIMDDETPKSICEVAPVFLFGIYEGFEFPIINSAKGQVEFDFMEGENIEVSRRSYRLFLSNELFFFGSIPENSSVYILTQVP